MGTDVYLEWTGKRESEEERQLNAAFSINAGNAGYLRASIDMARENAALRLLFPEQYWDSDDTTPFDFENTHSYAVHVCLLYLAASATDSDMPPSSEDVSKEVVTDALQRTLKKWQAEMDDGEAERDPEFDEAVRWHLSVLEFYDLGRRLQAEGKKPYPVIDW